MRPRVLTKRQERELLNRYQLWKENRPKNLQREFRISKATLWDYITRARTELE